jgi:hypothetical protein
MRRSLVITLILLLVPTLSLAQRSPRRNFPKYEVTLGLGGAAGFEKSIFNLQADEKSAPEAAFSIEGRQNLDEHVAVGIHAFGVGEDTPEYALVDAQGTAFVTTFSLVSVNFGLDGRYTLMRGPLTPYVWGGLGVVSGSADASRAGTLNLTGFSAGFGPGVTIALGPNFALGAQGFASFGSAKWEKAPFVNSSGRDFNPSLLGALVTLNVMWGYE